MERPVWRFARASSGERYATRLFAPRYAPIKLHYRQLDPDDPDEFYKVEVEAIDPAFTRYIAPTELERLKYRKIARRKAELIAAAIDEYRQLGPMRKRLRWVSNDLDFVFEPYRQKLIKRYGAKYWRLNSEKRVYLTALSWLLYWQTALRSKQEQIDIYHRTTAFSIYLNQRIVERGIKTPHEINNATQRKLEDFRAQQRSNAEPVVVLRPPLPKKDYNTREAQQELQLKRLRAQYAREQADRDLEIGIREKQSAHTQAQGHVAPSIATYEDIERFFNRTRKEVLRAMPLDQLRQHYAVALGRWW